MLTVAATEHIKQHVWLPKAIIRQHWNRWTLSVDDLLGVGYLTLVVSAKTFRDDKGAAFKTFATIRIRGALMDADERERNFARIATTPINLLPDCALPQPLPDLTEMDALRQRAHHVREVLRMLPARERMLLYMHYWEDVPLQDVAQAMGVTPARVSQIKRVAFERLRPLLQGVA